MRMWLQVLRIASPFIYFSSAKFQRCVCEFCISMYLRICFLICIFCCLSSGCRYWCVWTIVRPLKMVGERKCICINTTHLHSFPVSVCGIGNGSMCWANQSVCILNRKSMIHWSWHRCWFNYFCSHQLHCMQRTWLLFCPTLSAADLTTGGIPSLFAGFFSQSHIAEMDILLITHANSILFIVFFFRRMRRNNNHKKWII